MESKFAYYLWMRLKITAIVVTTLLPLISLVYFGLRGDGLFGSELILQTIFTLIYSVLLLMTATSGYYSMRHLYLRSHIWFLESYLPTISKETMPTESIYQNMLYKIDTFVTTIKRDLLIHETFPPPLDNVMLSFLNEKGCYIRSEHDFHFAAGSDADADADLLSKKED